jgi:hypothetical protein
MLVRLLGDTSEKIRWDAVTAMEYMDDPKIPGILKKAAQAEKSSWVKNYILNVLGRFENHQLGQAEPAAPPPQSKAAPLVPAAKGTTGTPRAAKPATKH